MHNWALLLAIFGSALSASAAKGISVAGSVSEPGSLDALPRPLGWRCTQSKYPLSHWWVVASISITVALRPASREDELTSGIADIEATRVSMNRSDPRNCASSREKVGLLSTYLVGTTESARLANWSADAITVRIAVARRTRLCRKFTLWEGCGRRKGDS